MHPDTKHVYGLTYVQKICTHKTVGRKQRRSDWLYYVNCPIIIAYGIVLYELSEL